MIWYAEPGKDRLYTPSSLCRHHHHHLPPHPCCRLALLMYWLALLMHGIMIMALRALVGEEGVRVVWQCVSVGRGRGCSNSVRLDTNRPTLQGRAMDRPLPKETIKQKMWIWHRQFRTEFLSNVRASACLSSLHFPQHLRVYLSPSLF